MIINVNIDDSNNNEIIINNNNESMNIDNQSI